MSHTINKLSFGHDYPGSKNPLDGLLMPSDRFSMAYKYFLKVVPTLYVDVNERKISTNQFSVTEHAAETNFATSSDLPGVFFYYDLSPIKVMFRDDEKEKFKLRKIGNAPCMLEIKVSIPPVTFSLLLPVLTLSLLQWKRVILDEAHTIRNR